MDQKLGGPPVEEEEERREARDDMLLPGILECSAGRLQSAVRIES